MSMYPYSRGHQRGARGHQVARKDHVGRPQACSENSISMINVFALTNINTKIIEGKSSKNFISEVCIKLVALRINRYTEVARCFKKVGDPCPTAFKQISMYPFRISADEHVPLKFLMTQ